MVLVTSRRTAALATISLVGTLFIARATDAYAQPPPEPSDALELTDEELAEIEEALASDQEHQPEATQAAGDPPDDGSEVIAIAADFLPNIAVIMDMAVAYFSDDEPLQTGGHDPTTTGFNLQQFELAIDKSVDPYFRLDAAILFSLDGVELEEVNVRREGDIPLQNNLPRQKAHEGIDVHRLACLLLWHIRELERPARHRPPVRALRGPSPAPRSTRGRAGASPSAAGSSCTGPCGCRARASRRCPRRGLGARISSKRERCACRLRRIWPSASPMGGDIRRTLTL